MGLLTNIKEYFSPKAYTESVQPLPDDTNILLKMHSDLMYITKITMKALLYARLNAGDPHKYDRTKLYDLFETYIDDLHLQATVNTLKANLVRQNFEVLNVSDSSINDNATIIFSKQWFTNLQNEFIDAMMWGHSLLNITYIYDDGFDYELVPRKHVRPETGEYFIDSFYQEGIYYRTPELYDYLIEIGSNDNLGLYNIVSVVALYKKFAQQYWVEFQEVFGSPLRVAKIKSRKDDTISYVDNALRNAGSLGYAIIGLEDSIEFIETNKTDSFKVYLEYLKYANNEMSKFLLGGIEMLEGSTNGSQARAIEHGKQSDHRTTAIVSGFTNFMNDVMIPKLKMLNIITDDIVLVPDKKEALTLEEKGNTDLKVIEIFNSGLFEPEYIENRYQVHFREGVKAKSDDNKK